MIVAGFVVFSFFLTTNINAQKISEIIVVKNFKFHCPCVNNGIGEELNGYITFQKDEDSKIQDFNVNGKLIGEVSGRIYTFIKDSNFKLSTGQIVFNISTIDENGQERNWQIIGEAKIIDPEFWPNDIQNTTFYCV